MKRSHWINSLLVLLLSGPAWADTLPIPASAELCGRCHRAIFEAWKDSSHSKAMESWLFQDALELTETDFGKGARRTCLRCHSPVGFALGDVNLKKVSWEGITCDYCHSLRSVNGRWKSKSGRRIHAGEKRPSEHASSMAHGTEFSEIHASALACAPCHVQRPRFPSAHHVFEWKNSRYAKEGKQCRPAICTAWP